LIHLALARSLQFLSDMKLNYSFNSKCLSLSIALSALLLNVGCGAFSPATTVQTGAAATTSTLAVATSSNSVAQGAPTTISVSGGIAPYTYSVTSGSGTIQADPSNTFAIYTASASAPVGSTVKISVADSASNVTTFTLSIVAAGTVTTTSIPTAAQLSCAGTYTIVDNSGNLSTLTIVEDSSGNLMGSIGTKGSVVPTPITSGTCTADNVIKFSTSTAQYEGYYFSDNFSQNDISMGGLVTTSGAAPTNWSTQ
jgi:hypothetical protein